MEKLIFLLIEKAAGTSQRAIFYQSFGKVEAGQTKRHSKTYVLLPPQGDRVSFQSLA